MNESFSYFHESNPFSTRFTAPGKLPFFFERSFALYIKSSRPAKFQEFFSLALGLGEDIRTSVCLQYLVDKFQGHSCRGQIVGAHGSGKTTLMLALKERLQREGYEIFSWTLHDQGRFLPDVFWYEMQRFLQSVPAKTGSSKKIIITLILILAQDCQLEWMSHTRVSQLAKSRT